MKKNLWFIGLLATIYSLVFSFDVNAGPNSNVLNPGEQLNKGQSLISNNHQYVLAFQTDGNLVLYKNGMALWNSGTVYSECEDPQTTDIYIPCSVKYAPRHEGNICVMQTDGNLVIYDINNSPLWNSGTCGNPNSHLILQDDGNLVIYKYKAVWASNTRQSDFPDVSYTGYNSLSANNALYPGQSISSANGWYHLYMQGDGNFVLYGPGGALWNTQTNGRPIQCAIMQGDGNLVLYEYSGQAAWASWTNGNGNPILVVQNDGNLVIYATAPIWSTGTNSH